MTRRRTPTVRGQAEYLGESRFRYTWPCGHTRVEALRDARGKLVGESGCRLMARWWSGRGSVGLPPCGTCARKAKAEESVR